MNISKSVVSIFKGPTNVLQNTTMYDSIGIIHPRNESDPRMSSPIRTYRMCNVKNIQDIHQSRFTRSLCGIDHAQYVSVQMYPALSSMSHPHEVCDAFEVGKEPRILTDINLEKWFDAKAMILSEIGFFLDSIERNTLAGIRVQTRTESDLRMD